MVAQNAELRRRLQKIHAESSLFTAAGAESSRLLISSNNDISLQISTQAPCGKASPDFDPFFELVFFRSSPVKRYKGSPYSIATRQLSCSLVGIYH